jgi:hypothetical protein
MSDGEDALSGLVAFPPRLGSIESRFGPLTTSQAAWLMGSASAGALVAYTLLGTFAHSLLVNVLAYGTFFAILATGMWLGLTRKEGLPRLRYLLLLQRFRSTPRVLTGPLAKRFVHLQDVTGDMLVLPHDVYARALEVSGVNYPLLSFSDQAQHLQAFLSVLNGLDFDVQLIARPEKFDNLPYVRALTDRGESETSAVIQDQLVGYAPFFDELTRNALDRKFYAVVSMNVRSERPDLFSEGKNPSPAQREQAARSVLDRRAAVLADHLRAGGLHAERLAGEGMATLLRTYCQFGTKTALPVSSFLDAVAPERVEIEPKDLTVGREHVRILQVERYPATLPYGWLMPFLTAQARVDVVLHLHPLLQEKAQALVNHEITRLQVELLGKRERGTVDTSALEHQVDAFEEARAALVRGDERLFMTGVYLACRADTRDELEALAAKVQGTLRGLMVGAKPPLFRPLPAYRTIMPFGRDFLADDYPLPSSSLATMFPFVSAVLAEEGGILYGINELNGTPVVFDRFSSDKTENYNTCIFGTSGSGKSYLAKLEVLRYRMLDPDLRVFIIDPLREFADTTIALDGTVLSIGRDGDTHLNPLWVGRDNSQRARHALEFLDVLLQWSPDEKEERALLDGTLSRMYRSREEEFTFQDLLAELEKEPSLQSEHLRLVLQPYVSGSCAFLNHPTDVDLGSSVVCFDIRDLDPDLFAPVMTLVLSYLFSECGRDAGRKIIVVDEAWHLMDRPGSAQALANLTRHSRHYNAGLTLISQTASDFLEHEKGRVVLANSSMVTLVRHRAVTGAMREHWSLTPAEVDLVRYAKTGKECGYSTALLLTGTMRTPLRIIASEGEHELITTNPQDLADRDEEDAAPALVASRSEETKEEP